MGWGTAQKFYSYNRKCQSWVGWEQTLNSDTQATIKVSGCARSGDGSGYYYAYDFGVTVTLYYRIDGGPWHTMKSTTTALNYGNEVGNISASVTVNRTHSTQVLTVACDADSTTGDWDTATVQMNININPKTKYTITLDENKPSASTATVQNMPPAQVKWYGESLALPTSTPSLNLYNFKGWNTEADGSGTSYAAGGTYPANSNAADTLFAQWELAYAYPTITNATVIRCNSSGSATEDGTYGKVVFDWAIDATADSGANTVRNAYVYWKPTTASTWDNASSQAISVSGTSGTGKTQVFGGGAISTDTSYDVRIAVTDNHQIDSAYCTGYRYLTLTQGYFTMDFLNGGHGVAMGTAATKADTFELAMDFDHSGGVTLDATAKAAWLDALGISELFHFETIVSQSASIGEGAIREFTATAPTVAGMSCRGIMQTWYDGSGNPLIGASWRTSSTETIHARVRANSASTIRVWWLLLYTPDALTTYGDWPE